jgi:hypothetical protein
MERSALHLVPPPSSFDYEGARPEVGSHHGVSAPERTNVKPSTPIPANVEIKRDPKVRQAKSVGCSGFRTVGAMVVAAPVDYSLDRKLERVAPHKPGPQAIKPEDCLWCANAQVKYKRPCRLHRASTSFRPGQRAHVQTCTVDGCRECSVILAQKGGI